MNTTLERAAFSAYRTQLASRATLTPEAERELAIRFKAGDRLAGHKLVEACLPFVMTIALEYRRWGLPLEDVVQEGNIGLLKAAERFDPDRGCRLATYAAYWIRAEIREYVARHYRIVRLGSSKGERRALRLFRQTQEQRPEVLAALSGLSTERVTELLPLFVQGDARLSPSNDGTSPLERLADRNLSAEDALRDAEEGELLRGAVQRAVSGLSEREQDIVRRRLLAEDPATLEQLGVAWGVSKERVRQIEVRAKTLMRAQLAEIAGAASATA